MTQYVYTCINLGSRISKRGIGCSGIDCSGMRWKICIYVYTYMYRYTQIYIYTHTQIQLHVTQSRISEKGRRFFVTQYIYTCINLGSRISKQGFFGRALVNIHRYIHIYICIYAYIYTHTYINTATCDTIADLRKRRRFFGCELVHTLSCTYVHIDICT